MNNSALDIIQAKNISRKFGEKYAVNDITLSIKKGEIYSFLGPNGSGKSTTIKMLVSLLDTTSGDIIIDGEKLTRTATNLRLKLGVALQEASLDESQTGVEFLYLQGRLYGLSGDVIKARIEELKPLIDIGDAILKPIKTYSGGMKRRLDLAASIFHKPSILFLDEPTTGLDPISRNKVWNEVKKLNAEGMTIFLTTQYLEEADALADRVGIMSKGKLIIEGTPEELKKQVGEDLIVATITSDGDAAQKAIEGVNQIEGVIDVLKNNNTLTISSKNGSTLIGKIAIYFDSQKIGLDSLTLRTTSLDDVFLKVTGASLEQ